MANKCAICIIVYIMHLFVYFIVHCDVIVKCN